MSERGAADGDDGELLSAHLGRSANCSSIGSYVDFLFLSATVSGSVMAALAVALAGADAIVEGPSSEVPRSDGASSAVGELLQEHRSAPPSAQPPSVGESADEASSEERR